MWLAGEDNPLGGLENTLGDTDTKTEETEGICITYLDVGQGDCALIECGAKTMLIDAGDNGNEDKVLGFLNSNGIKNLDYAVCTHMHSDHIGCMPEVIDEFSPDTVVMPTLEPELIPDTVTYSKLLESVSQSGAELITPMPGDSFDIGEASAVTLGPINDNAENHNDMSLVLKVTYGKNTFLFTGDAEKEEENDILQSGADIDCDVLKVGHHGSSNASSEAFIEAVTPEICVISVGKDNDYGHPHAVTISRLQRFTDKIYRTDICGNITVTSDGSEISVSTAK